MWCYLAWGRFSAPDQAAEESNPWREYLACLPDRQPDPTAWPEDSVALRLLQNTRVGEFIRECRQEVAEELREVLPRLPTAFRSGLDLERVLWGRGIHLSRCFPPEYAEPIGDEDNGRENKEGGPPIQALAPLEDEGEKPKEDDADTGDTGQHQSRLFLPGCLVPLRSRRPEPAPVVESPDHALYHT